MRLLEFISDSPLDEITVDDLFRRVKKGERDVANSWLVRAFETGQQDKTGKFRTMVEGEIGKAKFTIQKWIDNPTILYRGMGVQPKKNKVGVHWSPAIETAIQHGTFIMELEPTASLQVDWTGTILRRMSWPKEFEIMLIPNQPVLIKRLYERNGPELRKDFQALT